MHLLKQAIWGNISKRTLESNKCKSRTNATNVTMHLLWKCTVVKKCNQCDYASSQADDLRIHLKTHNGENSNKCNQCDYASSHAGYLRKHLKLYSGKKSHKLCVFSCWFFFQITSRLVDRFMPNKCNDCDYASCRADDLKTHLKMHIGEKSNNCSQCKFASSHECNLRKPLRTHSGEKSNKCNQCDFASSYAHVLRRHLKMHSGVKQSTVKQLQPCDFAYSDQS